MNLATSKAPRLSAGVAPTGIKNEKDAYKHGWSGEHQGKRWFALKENVSFTYDVCSEFLALANLTSYWECEVAEWLHRDKLVSDAIGTSTTRLRVWWQDDALAEKIGALSNNTNTFAIGDEAEQAWLDDNNFEKLPFQRDYYQNREKGWVALHTPLWFYVALGLYPKGEVDFLMTCPDCTELLWLDVKMNNNIKKHPNRFIKFKSSKHQFSGWARATRSGRNVFLAHLDKNHTEKWMFRSGEFVLEQAADTLPSKRMLNGGRKNSQQFKGGILLSLHSDRPPLGCSYSGLSDFELQLAVKRKRADTVELLTEMERAVIIKRLQGECLEW